MILSFYRKVRLGNRLNSITRSLVLEKRMAKPSGLLKGSHILSANQFDRNTTLELLQIAKEVKEATTEKGRLEVMRRFITANMFYEPSTRTVSSFHTAVMLMGGSVLPVSSITSSHQKGETLEDTIKTIMQYVDLIVMRHPEVGSAQRAAAVSSVPIINGGDGANEHPTQSLLDMFCIQSELGKLDGLTVALIGDLKFGRTVHSLSSLMANFDIRLELVSPEGLHMPDKVLNHLKQKGVKYRITSDLDSAITKADVLYVTRVQKERFDDIEDYNAVKDLYTFTSATMSKAKKNAILMHPLPRVNEISVDVDSDPRAIYFKQVGYGMYLRAALMGCVLGLF